MSQAHIKHNQAELPIAKYDPIVPVTAPFPSVSAHAKRKLWALRRKIMENSGARYTPVGVKPEGGSDLFGFCLNMFERLLRLTGFWKTGNRNAKNIQVRHLELFFANLPAAFDGYRILHLTDLHIDKFPGLEEAILDAVDGLKIDLCAMTGDFRADDDGPYEQIMAPMQRLADAIDAPDGIFAVLGNHDDHHLGLALERRLGIQLLANETTTLQRSNSSIHITGADDVNRFYTADAAQIFDTAPTGFSVALVHSPEMAEEASRGGQSLYLCGHTHGGQVCLPGGKPLVTHLNRNKDLASGSWKMGNMQGYTSPGAGVSGPPVRFFSRGEVTVVELRQSQEFRA